MEVAELAHLRRARDLLDREYARPLDVPVMARAALMSPSLFSRRFREAYGDTPYGYPHDLLLAAVDHHIPPADRQAMREIVAKGDLAVFIQVDDLDKTFESLRAAGAEILQEPVDQPYGVRDAAVRDPSGNHLRLSQPLAAQG